MKGLVLAVAAVAALALGVPSGRAADECDGLMVCIPVAGPWVAIPAPAGRAATSTAEWQLECPEGVVGGLDARLSDAAIAVAFSGRLGSPVNPGITTTDAVVFRAVYAGRTRRPTSFRPFIGCIPAQGGGRTPTGVSSPGAFKPGEPIVRRVRTLRVQPGLLARATHACRAGERLLAASYAVGLYTRREPSRAELGAVRVVQVVRGGRILASATRSGLPRAVRAEVQIHAECLR